MDALQQIKGVEILTVIDNYMDVWPAPPAPGFAEPLLRKKWAQVVIADGPSLINRG